MSQRQEFIELYHQRRHTVAELCCVFGISEKTAYKWLARFRIEGPRGLADRSHVPRNPPHQLSPEVIARLLECRVKHPSWGPRKLRHRLSSLDPSTHWPAASTIGSLLKRHGLVRSRRRGLRRRGPRLEQPLSSAQAPNDVWTADFKGEFPLRAGGQCYPLTVADLYSRMLLGCTALAGTASATTQLVFRRLFERYGLPRVIRSDNGVPFASAQALGGLSPLSLWWLRLGIRPERIEPGQPQQNGQHERMHRTLKAEAIRPQPASTLTEQQRRFDRFRHEFNTERPHEALEQRTPAELYTASPRSYPRKIPQFEYEPHFSIRLVGSNGFMKWRNSNIFLSSVLAHEYVGLEEIAEDQWRVVLGPLALGIYHQALKRFTPDVYWREQT